MSIIIDNLILCSTSEIFYKEYIGKISLHINISEIKKCPNIYGIVQVNLFLIDDTFQDINEDGILFNIIKLIDFYIKNDKEVLVNCSTGSSTSAAIVIAYLMYKNKLSVQEAISFVRQKRPSINPNYGFVCQLYNLKDSLHNLDNISLN